MHVNVNIKAYCKMSTYQNHINLGKFHHNLPTMIFKPCSGHLNFNNQIDPKFHQTSLFFWGSFGSHFCVSTPKSYLHFVWCIVFVVLFVGGKAQIQVYNSLVHRHHHHHHHHLGGFDDIQRNISRAPNDVCVEFDYC